MITITNVLLPNGTREDFSFTHAKSQQIEGSHLLALPAGIDPHVHFRTPGMEHKENWLSAAKASLKGGYTTVMDMPNTKPATITLERLIDKYQLIDSQLKAVGIPLRYQLYFGADKQRFEEIARLTSAERMPIGIKVFMGASTGELLMDDDSSLHALFAIAGRFDCLVAVHAEDEAMIQANTAHYQHRTDFATHSLIRTPEVAKAAVAKAIALAELYQVRLYILHVSSEPEIQLITEAKARGLKVYAETCPHYLFLSREDYPRLQGLAQMNPALRSLEDQDALWQAVQNGTIDTVGSDHAPHTLGEKQQSYGCCPSGVPGIETTLPLLYTAVREGKLSLNRLIELSSTRAREIFNLEPHDDLVLIDISQPRTVRNENLCTKAKWSPFVGQSLYGWPRYVCLDQHFYDLENL